MGWNIVKRSGIVSRTYSEWDTQEVEHTRSGTHKEWNSGKHKDTQS